MLVFVSLSALFGLREIAKANKNNSKQSKKKKIADPEMLQRASIIITVENKKW